MVVVPSSSRLDADSAAELTPAARELHAASIVIDGCSFFLRAYNERIVEAGLTAANFTVPMPEDDLPAALIRLASYHEPLAAIPACGSPGRWM